MHPFLTASIPGVGGRIRTTPEDFQVVERPLYMPCGTGEHLYVRVTKRGLSTPELVQRFSLTLGLKPSAIGVAGLKDARAVSTQMVSLRGVEADRLTRMAIDDRVLAIEVLGQHRNRLRNGHHAGNTFRLVIRDIATHADETIPLMVETLLRRGVPNYFGPQRQGRDGDNYRTGAALLIDKARRDKLSRAKRMWYLSCYQSYLFNRMLARRIERLDRIMTGDWAMKADNGACFLVDDADREQPRADRFEISPTGILFGSRVSWAVGEPGEIEQVVLAEEGTTREQLVQAAKECGFRGERRSLRIRLLELEWALAGSALTLSFTLPPGAYATSVLRELMKSPEMSGSSPR